VDQSHDAEEEIFYPGIFQAIGLLMLLLFLLIGLGAIIDNLGFFQEESLIISVGNSIAFAIILAWGAKKSRVPFREIFSMKPFRARLLIPMGLIVLGISIVGSELDNVFRAILPPPDWLSDIFLRLAGHDTNPWGSILALVIVAPMTEELLFRGLFLRGFLGRYAPHKAILGSAMLFGLFHLNPWQFVHTTAIGILLGWWFFKTRSLIPCIFGHALNNSLLFIYRDMFNLHISGYTAGMGQEVQFQPLWLDAVGLLLLICGIWLLIFLLQRAGESASQKQSSENAEAHPEAAC